MKDRIQTTIDKIGSDIDKINKNISEKQTEIKTLVDNKKIVEAALQVALDELNVLNENRNKLAGKVEALKEISEKEDDI